MSSPVQSPDLTRLLEALLSTSRAGHEVARTLADQAQERKTRTVVADLHARRAQRAHDAEVDDAEAQRFEAVAGSPWSRAR